MTNTQDSVHEARSITIPAGRGFIALSPEKNGAAVEYGAWDTADTFHLAGSVIAWDIEHEHLAGSGDRLIFGVTHSGRAAVVVDPIGVVSFDGGDSIMPVEMFLKQCGERCAPDVLQLLRALFPHR